MLKPKSDHFKELSSCSQCGKRARPFADIHGATGWILNLRACKCDKADMSPPQNTESQGQSHREKLQDNEPMPTEIDGVFEVLSVLGKGGMGTVYKVRNKVSGATMALKLIHATLSKDAAAVKRFEQEAKAVARLDHPNLVAVYGHGKTKGGESYLLMDFVEGETLARVIEREGALDEPRAIEIFSQICAALAHAHQQNLVHRDIKPGNILLSKSADGEEIARVVDFGIAKTLPSDDRETRDLTQTGEVFGSPHYMSPEQCLGFMLDQRSDIYSFGCLMYETLSGKPPFAGSNAIQLVVKHINDTPAAFIQFNGTAKMRALQSVTLKCLEKKQEDRWQAIDEIFDALTKIRIGKTAHNFHSERKNSEIVKYTLPVAWIIPLLLIVIGTFSLPWNCPLPPSTLPMECAEIYVSFSIFGLSAVLIGLLSALFLVPASDLAKISIDGKMSKLNAWSVNSLIFSGLIPLGMVPLLMAAVFAAYSPCYIQFMATIVLLGFIFSVWAAVSTVVCAFGAIIDKGHKKIRFGSLTPRIISISFAVIALFPFVFVNQSAHVAATAAVFISSFPKRLCGSAPSDLIQFALSIDPNDPAILEAAVQVSREQYNFPQAVKYLTEILDETSLFPSDRIRLLSARANLLKKQRLFDDAVKDYDNLVALSPDNLALLLERARCLLKTRQYNRALWDCETVRGFAPKDVDLFYIRASIYSRMGDFNKAIECMDQRMQLREGQTAAAHLFKSYLLKRTGDASAARRELVAATKYRVNPQTSMFVYAVKALAYRQLGQTASVEEQLRIVKKHGIDRKVMNSDLPEELQNELKGLLDSHDIRIASR